MSRLVHFLAVFGLGVVALFLCGVALDAAWAAFITPSLGVPAPGWRYGVGFALIIGLASTIGADFTKRFPDTWSDDAKALGAPFARAIAMLLLMLGVHLWKWALLS